MKQFVLAAIMASAALAGCATPIQLKGGLGPPPASQCVDFSERELSAIKREKVYVGMSASAAKCSWGRPDRINRTTSAYGTREQWVYSFGSRRNYIYIQNGQVDAIQN